MTIATYTSTSQITAYTGAHTLNVPGVRINIDVDLNTTAEAISDLVYFQTIRLFVAAALLFERRNAVHAQSIEVQKRRVIWAKDWVMYWACQPLIWLYVKSSKLRAVMAWFFFNEPLPTNIDNGAVVEVDFSNGDNMEVDAA